ncbi:hypothetical protein FRC07_002728 [Ceratobasidium sp. 392]|nr:hypothetical protein FRC07_002728 [Ceratobasidium sp. 392]
MPIHAWSDSLRPETPEPNTHQGRRNVPNSFATALAQIFSKYCTPRPSPYTTSTRLSTLVESAYLDEDGLDAWARDTNGAEFPAETKEEMKDTLDVTEQGDLTFTGFIQIYQLQTENDEEETWRDLSAHGFDRNLNLVSTRREEHQKTENGGVFTPTTRAETPEPDTQEGRRNIGTSIQLLDKNGAVSAKFEAALAHIFQKYSNKSSTPSQTAVKLLPLNPTGGMTEAGLDAWAQDTTGVSLSAETKEEMRTLDVNERGELTFRGFVQIYQLQTENDEAETWRDLSAHGFDRDLNLVSTRREDVETPIPTPTANAHT